LLHALVNFGILKPIVKLKNSDAVKERIKNEANYLLRAGICHQQEA
jgi:hypothetical protein